MHQAHSTRASRIYTHTHTYTHLPWVDHNHGFTSFLKPQEQPHGLSYNRKIAYTKLTYALRTWPWKVYTLTHLCTHLPPTEAMFLIFVILGIPLQRTQTLTNMLKNHLYDEYKHVSCTRYESAAYLGIYTVVHTSTHSTPCKYFRHHSEIKTGMAGIVCCTHMIESKERRWYIALFLRLWRALFKARTMPTHVYTHFWCTHRATRLSGEHRRAGLIQHCHTWYIMTKGMTPTLHGEQGCVQHLCCAGELGATFLEPHELRQTSNCPCKRGIQCPSTVNNMNARAEA